MKKKEVKALLLLTLVTILFSCKKDLYNFSDDQKSSANSQQFINDFKTKFYESKFDSKLNQKLNDTISIVWTLDWNKYTTSNVGDSLQYYYFELDPYTYNKKTSINHAAQEVNFKRVLIVGKTPTKQFYRLANYFFESNDTKSKSVKSIGHKYSFNNFTGHVLYENLNLNTYTERQYVNGANVTSSELGINNSSKVNSQKKPNYFSQQCYDELICYYYGFCKGATENNYNEAVITSVRSINTCSYPNDYWGCSFFEGWYYNYSERHTVCFTVEYPDPPVNPGGTVDPPTTNPTNPTQPTQPNKIPCPGDPVPSTTIARSSVNNVNGGRFGNTRTYPDGKPKAHYGTDILAYPNTPVYPVMDGKISSIRKTFSPGEYKENSLGNYVQIESTLPTGEKIQILYAHLDQVSNNLQVGSNVSIGTSFGLSGRTGNAAKVFEPHVHIQATINGTKVNAEPYIRTKFTTNGLPIVTPC